MGVAFGTGSCASSAPIVRMGHGISNEDIKIDETNAKDEVISGISGNSCSGRLSKSRLVSIINDQSVYHTKLVDSRLESSKLAFRP